ncbi:MAG TPA: DUF4173 domain-containing protein [Planctomycetes bacterium]|nr:DUF4173 domain-containing protein [Planctomycetota bacterium]
MAREQDPNMLGSEDLAASSAPPQQDAERPIAAIERPPVSWREFLAVGGIVLLADYTLFWGHGYAGCGAFFVFASTLLFAGMPSPHFSRHVWVCSGMMILVTAKLLWCGSPLAVFFGAALVVAIAMSAKGKTPFVLGLIVYASQTIQAGCLGIEHYFRSLTRLSPNIPRGNWLNIALPAVTVATFGGLFILANPDLATAFGDGFDWFVNNLSRWLFDRLPTPLEFVFWAAVGWVTIGLLRPVAIAAIDEEDEDYVLATTAHENAPLYFPFRNMLIMVIGLFAIYLVFEFSTLWFREFPRGFHYSGYAHQGAAWLTVALALATVILSLVFRGSVWCDPRLPRLRKLAWAWSLENVLLALAVYNRLFIYVGFNGMTRMRIIGVLGITAVLVGFIVVLLKIAHNRSFGWLIRRQLLTLSVSVYVFALTPLDTIVVRYNVHRILDGDLAPSVQISVHPINSEGVALLRPLLNCSNKTISEGIAAMLADREEHAIDRAIVQQRDGWTAYQIADTWLLNELKSHRSEWARFRDPIAREKALDAFQKYVYQWY